MRSEQRGYIEVRPRDPETREIIKSREAVQFPLGEDLIHAVRGKYDFNITHESNAIKRYAASLGISLQDVLDEYLGEQDFGRMKVERFLTNTGLRPLFSPVVEDGLRLGLNRIAAVWQNLIAKNVPIDSFTYEYYEFTNGTVNPTNPGQPLNTEAYKLKRIGQGAPIPVARVAVSGKSYTLYKQGRGIEWTDEAKAAPIDLAALWFQQVGLSLGWDYHDQIVDSLLNGYFPDNSDDAPVLATAVAATITFADLLTAVGTMQTVYGYTPTVMLMNLTRAVLVQTMTNAAGYPLFPNGVEAAGLPPIQLAATVPSDKIIFVDTGYALMRFVQKEFGTEFSRDVPTQTEGSYGTSVELTVPLFPSARLILDS
jgi:hypothetical protein